MTLEYTVTAEFNDPQIANAWIAWLLGGHFADVCRGGALDAVVVRVEGAPLKLQSRYRFASMEAFRAYERDHAPALRAEGVARFPPEQVRYTRGLAEVVGSFQPEKNVT